MITIFPATPTPDWPFVIKRKRESIVSKINIGEQVNIVSAFPKATIPPMTYRWLTKAERDTLYQFWDDRQGPGKAFYLFDWFQRNWPREFVGRGGPLPMKAVLLYSAKTATWTNLTDAANDTTANSATLLPAIADATAGDAIYFGARDVFDVLSMAIDTQGAGDWNTAGQWEYRKNNSTWYALTAGLTDGTTELKAATGTRTVAFTIPSDWISDEVGASGDEIEAFWIRYSVPSAYTPTTLPKVSAVTVNSKTYDLPWSTTTNLALKIDNVLKTGGGTDYTFASGTGAGGADRMALNSYATLGALVTAGGDGYLRIRAMFDGDEFPETTPTPGRFNIELSVREKTAWGERA